MEVKRCLCNYSPPSHNSSSFTTQSRTKVQMTFLISKLSIEKYSDQSEYLRHPMKPWQAEGVMQSGKQFRCENHGKPTPSSLTLALGVWQQHMEMTALPLISHEIHFEACVIFFNFILWMLLQKNKQVVCANVCSTLLNKYITINTIYKSQNDAELLKASAENVSVQFRSVTG